MLDNVSKVFGQNIKNMIFDFRPKHPKPTKTHFFPKTANQTAPSEQSTGAVRSNKKKKKIRFYLVLE